MNARDVMTEGPTSIRDSRSIREAMKLLQALEVRHLPVVDDQGDLIGMLSNRDLRGLTLPHVLTDVVMSSVGARLEAPVSSIMSAAVFAVRPDTDVREVANLMIDQKIGAVPVTSAAGALVGIITYVDLLRELAVVAPES